MPERNCGLKRAYLLHRLWTRILSWKRAGGEILAWNSWENQWWLGSECIPFKLCPRLCPRALSSSSCTVPKPTPAVPIFYMASTHWLLKICKNT